MKKIILAVFFIIILFGCKKAVSDEKNKLNDASANLNVSVDSVKTGVAITFIELGSVNCVPCKMMQPVMKQIEGKYKDQVNVVFYDVWTDKDASMAEKYKIRVIPTQVFLDKDGKEFFRHEGYFPFEEIEKIFNAKGVK